MRPKNSSFTALKKPPLTDLLLRKTKVDKPAQRLEFNDPTCRGLYVRITAASTKFGMRYRFQGKEYRTQLGEYPNLSLKDARDAADRLRIQIQDGYNPAEEKKNEEARQRKLQKQFTMLKDVVERFKEHHLPQLAANTQKAYIRELDKHILPLLGSVPIIEIENEHLINLFDYLYTELNIPASAKYAQAVLGAVLTYAKGRGYIKHKTELPKSFKQQLNKANPPRERTYTNVEISAHFNFVQEKLSNPVHQAYIKTLYYLGQRRTETLHLKWTDYDRSQQTIKLPAALTKNNVAHILPIGEELAQVLANLWGHTGHTEYLFSNLSTDQPFEPTLLINQFKEAFGEFQPHDIRRTVSTNLAALGVNSDVIDRILNHTPDKLRRTYNRHSYLPQMREALGIWEINLKQIISR